MPKVAVITPTYNRRDLIGKTMRSLAEQTYEDFTSLIVDDGSSDNTADVVSETAGKDRRFMYARRERTCSQKPSASFATNYAFDWLLTDPVLRDVRYIAFLDSDDILPQHSLQKRVEALENDPEHLMAYSHMAICYDSMSRIVEYRGPATRDPKKISKGIVRITGMGFPHRTMIFAKDLLPETGYFDENLGAGEDRDFTIRLLQRLEEKQVACVPEMLYYYRIHENGINAFYRRNNALKPDRTYLVRKHQKNPVARASSLVYAFMKSPQSFLPERVKRKLRPVKKMLLSRGLDDPFVQQIELQSHRA